MENFKIIVSSSHFGHINVARNDFLIRDTTAIQFSLSESFNSFIVEKENKLTDIPLLNVKLPKGLMINFNYDPKEKLIDIQSCIVSFEDIVYSHIKEIKLEASINNKTKLIIKTDKEQKFPEFVEVI